VIAAPPPVAVAVSPARVAVAAGETRELRIANAGSSDAVVDVLTASYTLGLRGRIRILPRGAAVSVRPARVVVPAHGAATVAVTGRRTTPGDHPALVLLTTERPQSDIAVRVRLGVVVLVRGGGRVVHRIVPERLRSAHGRLELWLRNLGNAAEGLRIRVRIGRTLLADSRQLLPHARGVSTFRFARRLHGGVLARVEIEYGGGVLRRTLRIRL
jgi:hypothetical protein